MLARTCLPHVVHFGRVGGWEGEQAARAFCAALLLSAAALRRCSADFASLFVSLCAISVDLRQGFSKSRWILPSSLGSS